eukprot:scaffold36311_cov119-Isochrysis_galbana.AAC.4
MLYSVLRLACLTTLAVDVQVPPAALSPGSGSAARLPDHRLSMEDASTAFNDAQADLDSLRQGVLNALSPAQLEPPDVTADAQADLNANFDSLKQSVLDALNLAQDPSKVIDAFAVLPAAGNEGVVGLDTAGNDLHENLPEMHDSGFVEPDGAQVALGMQDSIDTSLSWFTAHAEAPLATVVDGVGKQQGSDMSYVVPAAKSIIAFMAHLLGSAAIYLKEPSMGSAVDAMADVGSGPTPDMIGLVKQVMTTLGFV